MLVAHHGVFIAIMQVGAIAPAGIFIREGNIDIQFTISFSTPYHTIISHTMINLYSGEIDIAAVHPTSAVYIILPTGLDAPITIFIYPCSIG
ncbi:hypothetical protein BHU09_09775 [Tannerella sp. oral taxon 808]|nr:hypothetical protein BHU09_09775 [Tannerella sp. oral taxon 808]